MYADELLMPWLDRLRQDYRDVRVFDCHTHVGERDPSGFTATLDWLLGSLRMADARAAVFPLAEPDGYAKANLACVRAAADSAGTLTAFARLTPGERPTELLDEGLQAGARGVKLHPSSDEFSLEDPRLEGVYRVADERRLPVLVHAGPELSGIGESALAVCHRHPGLRMVLAHCALTDLGWIWRHVDATPNLFFDNAWWGPAHPLALFSLVPPGRVLLASDVPYCSPVSTAITTLRCGVQAGLGAAQLAAVAGAQFERLLGGQEPLDLGGPPPAERRTPGPVLELLSSQLLCSAEAMQRGEDPGVPLTVARHACKVPADDQDAEVVASVARLIELYDEHRDRLEKPNQYAPGWDLIMMAAIVARTPAAPVPS